MNASSLPIVRRSLLTMRKIIGAAVAGALCAVVLFGPGEAEFLRHQATLKSTVEQEPWLWGSLFFAAMFLLVGCSVPIASGMMVAGGFLFGRWRGLLICHSAAFLGAVLAMVLSRYLFQRAIRRLAARHERIHPWFIATDRGVEREGWYYLLLMRLTPIIPFFIINLLMGLSHIRLWTYSWVTALGMLPATVIFVNAGAAVSHIHSARDLVTPETLLSLMLLIFIPIVIRRILPRLRTSQPPNPNGE